MSWLLAAEMSLEHEETLASLGLEQPTPAAPRAMLSL